MRKWVSCTLALVLILLPAAASAMDVPLDPANKPRHGYKLLVPQPDIGDLDLSGLTDDELNDLDARVDAEIDARAAATAAPTEKPKNLRIEDELILFDREGVRMALKWIDLDYEGKTINFFVLVENNSGRQIDVDAIDSHIDGVEMDGWDVYEVPDGETHSGIFTLQPLEGEALYGKVLEKPRELRFIFKVWAPEDLHTLFMQDVTLVAE